MKRSRLHSSKLTEAASRNEGVSSLSLCRRPKRLKIITHYYPPDFAATGQFVQELASRLGSQQIAVSVFTSQPAYAYNCKKAPKRERTDALFVRRSKATRLWSQRIRGKALQGLVFYLRAIAHLLRATHRTDILLLTTAPAFLPTLGYLFNRCFGLPYICLLYDIYPDIAIQLAVIPSNHWLSKIWDKLNCLTWRNAQSIIVLSSTMKEHILTKCPDLAPQIHVIHNWVDPQQIVPLPKPDNWFALQHRLVNRFTVLYSGNLGRCHDFETIKDAIEYLRDQPILFLFIGGGDQYQPLKDWTQQLKLINVKFLPYQDRDVLPYSLTAADLSLVSIRDGMEGLVAPSKLYCALAAGRPVAAICNKRAYLHRLISYAQCGAGFSNGDGIGLAHFIDYLWRSPRAATQMGHAARKCFLDNFTVDDIAQRYATVIHPEGALESEDLC